MMPCYRATASSQQDTLTIVAYITAINASFNPALTLLLLCSGKHQPPSCLNTEAWSCHSLARRSGSEMQEFGRKEPISGRLLLWAETRRSEPPIIPVQMSSFCANKSYQQGQCRSLWRIAGGRFPWVNPFARGRTGRTWKCWLAASLPHSRCFFPICPLLSFLFSQHPIIWGILWPWQDNSAA